MSQRFNGVNFVYRSLEVYRTSHSYLRVLVIILSFNNGELHWRYDLDRLFDNLTDKSD